jgi:hypothetical protein
VIARRVTQRNADSDYKTEGVTIKIVSRITLACADRSRSTRRSIVRGHLRARQQRSGHARINFFSFCPRIRTKKLLALAATRPTVD